MSYIEVGTSFDGKEDVGEGCTHRNEFDGEDLQIDNNFNGTPTCFQIIPFTILECTY